MFTLFSCKNGRRIYAGKVSDKGKDSFLLTGTDWNSEGQFDEEKKLELTIDGSVPKSRREFKNGDTIVVSVMPSKDNVEKGTAEEILTLGHCLVATNEKGNQKLIVFGRVFKKKWNDSHSAVTISFTDIKDSKDQFVGYKSTWTKDGSEKITYWLNTIACNGGQFKSTMGDRVDSVLNRGNLCIMICNINKSEYNGQTRIGYFTMRFDRVSYPNSNKNNNSGESNNTNSSGSSANSNTADNAEKSSSDGFMSIDDLLDEELPFN